jgi:hypothetical protein
LMAHASEPYSRDIWTVVVATTSTSKSKGFELLRGRSGEADRALGPETAEKKLAEVIRSEVVAPKLNASQHPIDWAALETATFAQYGALGREVITGAKMMDDWVKKDWASFGRSYVRYFETATPRSRYPIHSVSYQVLENVSDAQALGKAIAVMKWDLEQDKPDPVFGQYDPTELDTYANLLYKAGRRAEALEWEQQAVKLSDGRDAEITRHLEKIKRGVPTWTIH